MDSESLKEFLTKFYRDVANQYKKAIEELEVSDPKSAQMLLGCKYSVFYSNPFTTLKKDLIYTLGLNPGGTPTDETIFSARRYDLFSKTIQTGPNILVRNGKAKTGRYGPVGGPAPRQSQGQFLRFILNELGS